MAFVQLQNIGISFADRQILKDVNLTVSPGKRIALCGFNGSGKSTLMKIIAGLVEQDEGEIAHSKNIEISYLPQMELIRSDRTVQEEAMAGCTLREDDSEWIRKEVAACRLLSGLGFPNGDFNKGARSLSSGWQMRVALARILLRAPDILLLDEPTNYLDLDAREWLERFLKHFPGAVVLVSHDRSFLENSCDSVAQLRSTRLRLYQGSYSNYEKQLNAELQDWETRWKEQKKEIERIQTYVDRFRYNNRKAPQIQSRIKMLDKMEIIPPPPAFKTINFSFSSAPLETKTPLRCENLGRCYGARLVFEHLNLVLQQGSRTAVVGRNGAGKTTLLRIIAGEDQEHDGRIILGKGTRVGYFNAEQKSRLNTSLNVFEEACGQTRQSENFVRDILGVFMFSGDDIHKRVGVLSGGELSRLALVKILLQPFNLLILDEPTNHLDMNSRDALLNALEGFGGTLIIVSHDRYFLNRIAEQVLELDACRGRFYLGSYGYYRERKTREADADGGRPEGGGGMARRVRGLEVEGVQRSPEKNNQEEHKRRRNRITALRKREEALLHRMEASEKEALRLRETLELPENYADPGRARSLSEDLKAVKGLIRAIGAEWEATAGALEEAEREGLDSFEIPRRIDGR